MARSKKGTPSKKAAKKKSKSSKKSSSTPQQVIRDPRAMEGTMFRLTQLMQEQEFESVDEANAFLGQFMGKKDIPLSLENLTPAGQAQEKMYQAWDATGKKRVALAREALEIFPDCADAYVLLAEETARSAEEALPLYEQGVAAGERALGPEYFKEEVGNFWGILETRPYMRAREGVAECLMAMGKLKESASHYEEMLRLNPGDNQGHRYMLARIYLVEEMNEEMGRLLDQYGDEASAEWLYTRALWLYRNKGDTRASRNALKEALEQNRFVPMYVCGFKKPPRRLPEYISFGDESEALHYLESYLDYWEATPGALEWFVTVFAELIEDFKQNQSVQ